MASKLLLSPDKELVFYSQLVDMRPHGVNNGLRNLYKAVTKLRYLQNQVGYLGRGKGKGAGKRETQGLVTEMWAQCHQVL